MSLKIPVGITLKSKEEFEKKAKETFLIKLLIPAKYDMVFSI